MKNGAGSPWQKLGTREKTFNVPPPALAN